MAKGDVEEILCQDYAKIEKMFAALDDVSDARKCESRVETIIFAIHELLALERSVVYPAVSKALQDDALERRGLAESEEIDTIIDHMRTLCADIDQQQYQEKIAELRDSVKHHARFEEKELFPLIKNKKLNSSELKNAMESYCKVHRDIKC